MWENIYSSTNSLEDKGGRSFALRGIEPYLLDHCKCRDSDVGQNMDYHKD